MFGPSLVTDICGSYVISTDSRFGGMEYSSLPDGQRSTIRIKRALTSGSDVRSIICQTFVKRSPQKPACVQSSKSSDRRTPSPSQTSRLVADGARSAVSVPSNPMVSCVESQKGLRLECPQRQSS